jgi:hypothetical protein
VRTQEPKEFNLYLGLGFYGTNLKYVDGAAPPPRGARDAKSAEYDIVTRMYVNRKTAAAWTEARAHAHFGAL